MATMRQIKDGLEILLRHVKDDGDVDAQHDTIYAAGPKPDALGHDDAAALDALGWKWDEECYSWRRFT